ncbi:hypothetical protein [Candidatus Paracaedibacter symbiosus]|nr:hypothetical protein [Candidatus Paracaedibacter symbiosus]
MTRELRRKKARKTAASQRIKKFTCSLMINVILLESLTPVVQAMEQEEG